MQTNPAKELPREPKRPEKQHRWHFYRAGGVDQVQLRDGDDLRGLASLDTKLWVAVAMPTRGVYVDPKTLAALDTDGDGRIRIPEILKAIEWLDTTLQSLDIVLQKGDDLPLDAIKDPAVQAGARRVLANLKKAEASSINVADLADPSKLFADTWFNGDGIVPAEAAEDPSLRAAIEDVIACQGALSDRSGKPGIDRPRLETFFAQVKAIQAWQARADATILPLAAATAAAASALGAVKAKIDDYFVRCRLAALDSRAAAALSGSDADLAALAPLELGAAPEILKRLPLGRIEANRPLPLAEGVSPAWSAEINAFVKECVVPILGEKRVLSPEDFDAIQARLAPHQAWWAEKPATSVEKLGLPRVAQLAAGDFEARIGGLLLQDLALEKESAQIDAVQRLLLFRRDLADVLHNFVNFSHFYAHKGAAFQAGTLVLDGRSCRLCLEVTDVARHASLAPMSGIFLAYCECSRPGAEKMTIAAAFTDGDSDHLTVGRNGIFFDRKGRDWDATITKLVSNPISIREAFWSPYKKLVRMVDEQIGKRAAAADADSNTRMGNTAKAIAVADQPEAKKDKKEDDKPKIDVGTVAAIGVAIGGIGAMFTGVLTAFFGLGLWMPLGLIAVLLSISGPSMLLAYLKLRQRNLGPLLDANGWAINGRALINVPFGGALTDVARLPKNADRSLQDPYAEKRRPWGFYLFLVALVVLAAVWYVGRLDAWLPEAIRSSTILPR
jgi:hypothetical protein